jgi:UDP-GlcNAc:undecaprenyl-phosphate/decaprenyl-phosphate GlcNAc-1-phosphate transferase
MFLSISVFCFVASLILTKCTLFVSKKYRILDHANTDFSRKSQALPVPLLGGLGFSIVGIYASLCVWIAMQNDWFDLKSRLIQNINLQFEFGWIIVASLIIIVAGFLDDKYNLSSTQMLIPVNLAILIAVFAGGLKIDTLSYPFDAILPNLGFLHSLLAYIWILLCLSATKFLDGHDGLVSSIGIINLGSIAIISLFANVNQPFVFILAIIWSSSILGFLPYNLPDAKMYLGEIGSEMIGFIIGVLSIISGAKVATSASIIGWFIFDLVLVFWIRYKSGKNIFAPGREHWHFRLLDLGYNKWQVLILTVLIIIISSLLGVILPTLYKPGIFVMQFLILTLLYFYSKEDLKK